MILLEFHKAKQEKLKFFFLWYIRQHHFPDKNKPKRILWTQLNKSLLIKMIVSYNTACIEVFHDTFFLLLCGRLRPNEWIECNELKNIFRSSPVYEGAPLKN